MFVTFVGTAYHRNHQNLHVFVISLWKQFFVSHKKIFFCKGLVRKNLCLSCASHQFLWVCNSTDLDEVTPSLHCSCMMSSLYIWQLQWKQSCCKHVLSSACVPVWNVCLQQVRGLTLLMVVGLLLGTNSRWRWFCGLMSASPLCTKPSPMFCLDWEQQLWAHFLEPVLDVEMGWAALTPLKSLSSPVISLRPEQLTLHNAAIVLIRSDQFWKCFSKSILQHYKKIISCLRRSPSGVYSSFTERCFAFPR